MCPIIFRLIFAFNLLLAMSVVQAADVQSNAKFRYRYGYIHLLGKGQRIYLFHNVSKRPVLLNRHFRFDPGASAGWASEIMPGRWSAIILNRSPFVMSCQLKQKQRYRKTCCKHPIKVWPIPSFTSKRVQTGGFWIAENKTCKSLQVRVKARGFQLQFPPCS